MDRKQKLLSNTLVLAVGTFSSKLLVFFMMPLYTACLSPGEYSIADLITQTANFLIPIACAGITDGIFRFAMERNEDKKSVFSSGIAVLLAMSAGFLLLSPLLGLYGQLNRYVWLVAFYVLAANLHSAVAQYIRARGDMTLFSIGGILGTALTIVFNLLFLLVFKMGVTGYVLSVVLGDVLTTVFLVLFSGVWQDVDFRAVRRDKIAEMLKYSIPMIPAVIFWWVTSVSDRFLVIALKGDAVNGLYAAAYKVPTLLTLLCTVFMEAWQFSAVAERDERERAAFFTEVFAGLEGLLFLAASALTLLAGPITKLLLADDYYEAWRYIPVLLLAMVCSSLVTFMGSVYMVRKKSMYSFVTAAIGAGVNIVLNLILIPPFSAMGAAVATFISYLVVLVIRSVHTVKLVRFRVGVPRLAFNTVVLVGQCILALSENRFRVPLMILLFTLIFAANGLDVLRNGFGILENLRKRTSNEKKE